MLKKLVPNSVNFIHSLYRILKNKSQVMVYQGLFTTWKCKIKCKIEREKDTQVAEGPRGRFKDPKDKCSIGDNPPITALTSPCGGLLVDFYC